MHFERFCFNGRCFFKDDPNNFLQQDEPVYDNLPLKHRLECKFDIEGIVNQLKEYNPFFEVNYDPGTYLCGYAYLRSSVELANDADTHSFFTHIPDGFDDLPFQAQTMYQFILRYAGQYYPNLCFTNSGEPDANLNGAPQRATPENFKKAGHAPEQDGHNVAT